MRGKMTKDTRKVQEGGRTRARERKKGVVKKCRRKGRNEVFF